MTHFQTFVSIKHCVALIFVIESVSSSFGQTPAKPADYSQEAFVIEDRTTETVFSDDGTSEQKGAFRIRLQSDAGVQAFGVVTVPYQKATQSVDIDYVRVRKPDGSTTSTPTDEPQDVEAEITRQAPMYSDLREKHIAVKGLGAGDVLEYQVRWHTTKPLAKGQFWETYDFFPGSIVLQEKLKVSVPRDRAVKWKSEGYTPVITETGAVRVYEWTHAQLAHKSADEEKKEAAQNARDAARGKLPQPTIQLSSFTSWAEVGQWYSGLQQERVKPTPEIREKALALTKGIDGDDAKARAIYRYVSTQYRYIGIDFGIGRYQPHAAGEVLGNQYGDCKDKHTLLAALLDSVGIAAYPALINSSRDLDPAVPSPAQFDHVVTVIPQGNRLVWLDSTPGAAPFGYLMNGLRAKHALIIPVSKESSLVTTPTLPPVSPVETFRLDAKLNDAGTMEGKIERTFESDDAEILLRLAFRATPSLQWKDLAQQLSFAAGFVGDVSEVTTSSADKTDEPFHLTYHYLRKDYLDTTSKRIGTPIPSMALPPVPDDDSGQHDPIWLGPFSEYRYESHLEFPKGLYPSLPKTFDLIAPFGDYHIAYQFKGAVLTARKHLTMKMEEVLPGEIAAYKKFLVAIQNSQSLINVRLGALALFSYQEDFWELPNSENADAARAYGDAQTCFNKGDFQGQVKAIKHAVELDPQYVRAWLWLGETYKYQNQGELAVAAYRKAIEVDPGQPVSYRALGFALLAARKPEEAAAASRKLLQVSPDDLLGLSLLGTSLLQLKKCAEAAEAYEGATRVAPDVAELRVSLGSSLFCAGEVERSAVELRKAADMDPGPTSLNAVAYQLAEENTALDDALKYSGKAVGQAAADSRKLDLSAIEAKDLASTSTLAAYWDTLGWVYFKMGKYSQAENYLESAWLLSQAPVIGDHLAQVYEKENKKQEAMHMYRLTLKRYRDGAEGIAKTRERMERLVPGSSTLDHKTENETIDELSKMRTVILRKSSPETASAEFFVVFSQDPKTKSVRVEETKYISGSNLLKDRGPAIQSASFHMVLPTEGEARVLRRGVMGCFPNSGCSFTLLNADDVHSVN